MPAVGLRSWRAHQRTGRPLQGFPWNMGNKLYILPEPSFPDCFGSEKQGTVQRMWLSHPLPMTMKQKEDMLSEQPVCMRWQEPASPEWKWLEHIETYVRPGLGYNRHLLCLTVSLFVIWLGSCCVGGAQPQWDLFCSLPACSEGDVRPRYLPALSSWRYFRWLKLLIEDTCYFSFRENMGLLFGICFFHVSWNSISFTPVEVTNGKQVTSDFA